MAYITGTGTSAQFYQAIIDQAVAEGWTEAGGIGTGFPITNGSVFVNMAEYGITLTDRTNNGALVRGVNRGSIGIGLTSSESQANSNTAGVRIFLDEFTYDINEWYIFTDSAGNHLHFAFKYSNLFYPEVWCHGGFGYINKEGMTHGDIFYASATCVPPFRTSDPNVSDELGYRNGSRGWPYGSRFSENDNAVIAIADHDESKTQYILFPPSPFNAGGGFPNTGEVYNNGAFTCFGLGTGVQDRSIQPDLISADLEMTGFTSCVTVPLNNPFSGSVSLMPAMFILNNSNLSPSELATKQSLLVYLGSYPDIRACTLDGLSTGAEVSFMTDTWKVFPFIRRTTRDLMNIVGTTSSGQQGIAYRKIV